MNFEETKTVKSYFSSSLSSLLGFWVVKSFFLSIFLFAKCLFAIPRQLVLCEMAQSCLSYGLLVTMSYSSHHSQLHPGFSITRLVAVQFCLAEVSLFCFDRSVVTLYRRASVYTTLPSPISCSQCFPFTYCEYRTCISS